MNYKALHTCITVKNLEESIKFYENVLNMNQVNISFQYEIDDVLASSYTFGKEGPMMLLGNALENQFEINSVNIVCLNDSFFSNINW